MHPQKVLIISNEKYATPHIQLILTSIECDVEVLRTVQSGLQHFNSDRPDMTIIDLDIEENQGLKCAEKLKAYDPMHIILGFTSQQNLLNRSHRAISILLSKQDISMSFLEAFKEVTHLFTLNHRLKVNLQNIVGKSPLADKLRILITKAARANGNVLISGENGTGKELVARAVSSLSPIYVTVNCSAIPENLFESELFGHVKGAFTGAAMDRTGMFEEADGGVLFLDEIGDLPMAMQTKLLRALQEGEVRPIGSNRNISVDVRVICATNKDLQKEIKEGNFREDLYYRLNVIPILVAPLRDRIEDLYTLVPHFLDKYAFDEHHIAQLSPEAWKLLESHPFMGNVRELENIVHRAVSLTDALEISEFEIAQYVSPISNELLFNLDYTGLKEYLYSQERRYFIQKLTEYKGRVNKAAQAIGINRTAMHNRITKLEIDLESIRGLFRENSNE
ncbi:MAG: sigma-54 dependent transcriptional regulator [Fibrobacterales bacterium]